MFSGFHKDKKSCEMDDPCHIGVSKLNFPLGSVLSAHILVSGL
jgi:hypothetical protein